MLRTFFGDQGTRDDLVTSMHTTAEMARSMLEEMLGFVEEYLEEGGPLSMLEAQPDRGAAHRVEFPGSRRSPNACTSSPWRSTSRHGC